MQIAWSPGLDGEHDRRRRHHRSGDDPETDSVQEHALAPFRSGALPTAT
jgi:hypothetical protein